MSIHRLLLIAGLLAVGACATPGPFAACIAEPDADTEETVCPPDRTLPGGLAQPITDEAEDE